ncbi:hypothetical protein DEU56DRAFT_919993 [Suillus clintonianus]|uniref:uncharacterized protein n=1 Tax=Suillus clintonianus TaxID=1904413 RepID=UPI001B87CA9B|nr:uncharacterized protein DEU56DRAFT_919993 [Suillus clintonianus]KAG2111490.1 hypothetical protein DEU56DRAFT_919993 [Suillus clintonianus]
MCFQIPLAHLHATSNATEYTAVDPTGQINLRTTYLDGTPAGATPELELGVNTDLFEDPWNESQNDTSFLDTEPYNITGSKEIQQRTVGKDDPIRIWISERQTYLDEFIRLEGRGDTCHSCHSCGNSNAVFRCEDCFSVALYCQSCVMNLHQNMPLHRLKKWHDGAGQRCRKPKPAFDDDFTVIDVHGIHEVALDFCNSTSTDPRTAATFTVLEHFHLLSFESKVSAFEFYHCVARRSDNTGVKPIKDRYSVFLRMMAEWRNLKALKRAGRGHDPAGVSATKEGEIVVLCPACPHPGKNVPETLEDVSPGNRWIYSLFLAIDANFRLKRRLVSSDDRDPGLSQGWGYFVKESNYKAYLRENASLAQEKSNCVSHNAVNMADTKSSKGLAATGVGTVVCARHDMRLANGVGDLQKGENLLRTFTLFINPSVNFSYNIACQWHKKLWHRVSTALPLRLHPSSTQQYRFFIPKFHLAAHIAACQTTFSFNWSPYVGRTDGEAPERGWADINRVAASTKEMAPGTRRDVLDDHFGDWNWKKVTGLGRTLLRKITDATHAERDHRHALADLEGSIKESELGAVSLVAWTEEVVAWESDHTKPNPFNSQSQEMTQAAVRLALIQQDAKDLEEGSSISLHSEVTPSILISTGLDLENAQRRLWVDNAGLTQHSTNNQQTKILMRRNALQRRIDSWIDIQVLYMPSVAHFHATGLSLSDEGTVDETTGCPKAKLNSIKAEDIPLFLPSSICNLTTCDTKLLEVEWSLRLAQANDALEGMPLSHPSPPPASTLQGTNKFADKVLTLVPKRPFQAVEDRLILSHEKYLAGSTIAAIEESDLRQWGDLEVAIKAQRSCHGFGMYTEFLRTTVTGFRIRYALSGAKRGPDATGGLKKSNALEEMRRVLEFLDWQAKWWEARVTLRVAEQSEDNEGLVAYAKRQAAIRRSLEANAPAEEGPSIDAPPHGDLDDLD